MNKNFYNSLSAEQQEIVKTGAEHAMDYDWSIAEDSEKENIAFFEEYGLEIIYPDEAWISAMAATQEATVEWAENRTPGARDLIESIKAIQ